MTLVLSKSSELPIYTQIYNQISRQILSGELKPDTQLPPIRSVANELRISVIPVKMAWEELDRNCFIKTIVGKGTFVADIPVNQIQEIKNEKINDIVEEFCKKAKDENISLEKLIELIKMNYN